VTALGGLGLVACLSCVLGSGSNEVAGDLCTFERSMYYSLSSVMYLVVLAQ
jgi:hypothetical protein